MIIPTFLRKFLLFPFRYQLFHTLLPFVYYLRYSSDPSTSLSPDEIQLPVRRELANLILSYDPPVVVDYGCGFGANALALSSSGFLGVYIGIDTLSSPLKVLGNQFRSSKLINPSFLLLNKFHDLAVFHSLVLLDAVCLYIHPHRLYCFISDTINCGNILVIHEPLLLLEEMQGSLYIYNADSATWTYSIEYFANICKSCQAPYIVKPVLGSSLKWSLYDCFLILNPKI